MKKAIKVLLIIAGVFVALVIAFILLAHFSDHAKISLPVKHKQSFKDDKIAQFPSKLHVEGNKIVNSNNEPVVFKGLMAPDPEKLDFKNKFKKDYYSGIGEKGANVIRVPVHPERWVGDKDYLWRYLDPIVAWAGESNMYVIIDWHYIGNIATGEGSEMPDIKEKPRDLTKVFWGQVAEYFKDAPNVIFEIYNEPADISANEWHEDADEIVKTIRSTGAEQLVIAGGIDYSYDLSWVKEKPIKDNNLAYATHVYPSRWGWDKHFGDIQKVYPVVVTEWGFMDENRSQTKQGFLISDAEAYGKPLLKYLDERNIGWIACWYDDEWEPPMFTKKYKDYTNYGKFVFEQLKNNKHK